MRRLLAIALVVLYWLPLVCALLPGLQDASLPACCRRHGAHHCAMAMMSRAQEGPGHFFAAPRHCPLYRNSARATVPAFVPRPKVVAHQPPSIRAWFLAFDSASVDAAGASSVRGPPLPLLNLA